jgi:hypothetical protein
MVDSLTEKYDTLCQVSRKIYFGLLIYFLWQLAIQYKSLPFIFAVIMFTAPWTHLTIIIVV